MLIVSALIKSGNVLDAMMGGFLTQVFAVASLIIVILFNMIREIQIFVTFVQQEQ